MNIKTPTGRRPVGAHRISYAIHFSEVPDDLCVCHKCDNPKCVRPDHLFLGTKADNNADGRAKGRITVSEAFKQSSKGRTEPRTYGEVHGMAKVTDFQVEEIRNRREQGEKVSVLAKDYGLGLTQVYRIVKLQGRTKCFPR